MRVEIAKREQVVLDTKEDGAQVLYKDDTQSYSLDAIISVGYRINSMRATSFRRWSTTVLREFAIKGYVFALLCGK